MIKRLLDIAGSARATVGCLALLAVLVVSGTLYQASHGLYEARRIFFDSWLFLVRGILPLPGAQLVMTALFLNLLASMIRRFRIRIDWAGLWMIHLGLIVLLLGGFVTRRHGSESQLTLAEGEAANVAIAPRAWEIAFFRESAGGRRVSAFDLEQIPLNQLVRVPDFAVDFVLLSRRHAPPTAEIALSSLKHGNPLVLSGMDTNHVSVHVDGLPLSVALRRKRIFLPVTIRLVEFEKQFHPGTMIPSSFHSRVEIDPLGMRRSAVISMNNPLRLGEWTFYQSSYADLPGGGESSTLAVTRNRARYLPYIGTALTVAGLLLHFLLKAAGRRIAAAAVIAILCSLTAQAGDAPPLRLDELAVIPVLEGGRLMPMDSMARLRLLQFSGRSSLADQSALEWFADVLFDPQTSFDTEVFLVGNPDAAVALGLPVRGRRTRYSVNQLEREIPRLEGIADAARGMDPQLLDAAGRELIRVHENIRTFSAMALGFRLPLIPAGTQAADPWVSPQELMSGSPPLELLAAVQTFSSMGAAYRARSQDSFDDAARRFRNFIEQRTGSAAGQGRIRAEVRLNRIKPFARAEILYGLAFLAALLAVATGSRYASRAAAAVLVLGWLVHAGGLLTRAFIMGRPPVTNLYSTFLFVALTTVVLGGFIELRLRTGLGLLSASFSGLALLLFSRRFEAGDTMQKVAAVLDSNLWLTAHVLTIMIGFAGCLLAGLIGHVVLVQQCRRDRRSNAAATYRAMTGMLAIGLTFTFLGTMLGGVWADQAWGRFWGWDPKENGALLVILWCSILFHARPAGLIKDAGMAAGCVFGNVVVVLAWLGVNLLGVGLHSYGYTSGIAVGLALFACAELAFVATSAACIHRRSKPLLPTGGEPF